MRLCVRGVVRGLVLGVSYYLVGGDSSGHCVSPVTRPLDTIEGSSNMKVLKPALERVGTVGVCWIENVELDMCIVPINVSTATGFEVFAMISQGYEFLLEYDCSGSEFAYSI